MRNRAYVGTKVLKDGCTVTEVIMSATEPTEASHGNIYRYAVGPFQTKRDAQAYVDSNGQLWYREPVTSFKADEVDMLPTVYTNYLPRCPECKHDLHVRRNRRNHVIMFCTNPKCDLFDKNRPVVFM